MAAQWRRTPRDRRRRTHGQNFLTSAEVIADFVRSLDIEPGELVVDVGAGRGALTLPIARAGARVLAVESDPVWTQQLTNRVASAGLAKQVQVIRTDLRRLSWPSEPYRVAASPPYSLTTALLARLLDEPHEGPFRADLILQYEVVRKHASRPPAALRTAAWAPWWEFEVGGKISRRAFRPVPSVDSAVLVIRRRQESILPDWVAPQLRQALRGVWHPPG